MIRKFSKLRGSSIWHNRVLEVTREGLHKQWRSLKAEKRRIECDSATAERKEHRLSKPRTKEKARRAACVLLRLFYETNVVSFPGPAQHSGTEKRWSWAGPENDLRLLLSSLILSLGLETWLTGETPEIKSVQIHVTCTSSAYLGYISSKCKINYQSLFPFMPLLAAALLSFMPCTASSGLPHNATHSASYSYNILDAAPGGLWQITVL